MSSNGSTTLSERATELRDDLSERLDGDAGERAREQVEELRDRARTAGEQARERAGEVAETLEPARRRAEYTTGSALRLLARGLTLVPGVLADILALLSRIARSAAGQADELTERGREVAARLEPPRHVRRRNRRRTAGWFAGGVAIGAVAGWVAHERLGSADADEDAPPPPPPANAAFN